MRILAKGNLPKKSKKPNGRKVLKRYMPKTKTKKTITGGTFNSIL
jgi:hypothetical protein